VVKVVVAKKAIKPKKLAKAVKAINAKAVRVTALAAAGLAKQPILLLEAYYYLKDWKLHFQSF
jgi:hypothetical protein